MLFQTFTHKAYRKQLITRAVLKDAAGVVVPNGDYNLTFKLYDAESGGAALWNETQTISVVGGIINTHLGVQHQYLLQHVVPKPSGWALSVNREANLHHE